MPQVHKMPAVLHASLYTFCQWYKDVVCKDMGNSRAGVQPRFYLRLILLHALNYSFSIFFSLILVTIAAMDCPASAAPHWHLLMEKQHSRHTAKTHIHTQKPTPVLTLLPIPSISPLEIDWKAMNESHWQTRSVYVHLITGYGHKATLSNCGW